jgi:hypothetical protein
MTSHDFKTFLALLTIASLPGCLVRERRMERPRDCRHGEYIERHREHERWIDGRWRCD